jgi:hypothetical protein
MSGAPRRSAVIAVAVMLAASVVSPVGAVPAGPKVGGLSLSSDAAGELSVTWEAVSPAPTDYRLVWAKVGERFVSYKSADAATGNAYPVGESWTLSDLEAGAEYKVRVRARFDRAIFRNGPWSDLATLVIAAPPPLPAQQSEENEDDNEGNQDEDDNEGNQDEDDNEGNQDEDDNEGNQDEDDNEGNQDEDDNEGNQDEGNQDEDADGDSGSVSESVSESVSVSEPAGDDLAGSTSSAGRLAVGGSVSGVIERVWDQDWYGVDLVAGTMYVFDHRGASSDGGTLVDPLLLGLHDAEGVMIAGTRANDGGKVYDSRLTYQAQSTGAYWVAVTGGEVDYIGIGSYTLSLAGQSAPAAPTQLHIRSDSASEVDLRWTAPVDASVTGYQVERSIDGGDFAVLRADTGSTGGRFTNSGRFVDNSPHNDGASAYRVAAINPIGIGEASNTVERAAPQAPPAPTWLRITTDSTSEVVLRWTAAPIGASVTGYQVERSIDGGDFAVLRADTGSARAGFTDNSPHNDGASAYRVAAINPIGIGEVSNTVGRAAPPPSYHEQIERSLRESLVPLGAIFHGPPPLETASASVDEAGLMVRNVQYRKDPRTWAQRWAYHVAAWDRQWIVQRIDPPAAGEFKLTTVTIPLRLLDAGAGRPVPRVTLYSSSATYPNTPVQKLATLTNPDDMVDMSGPYYYTSGEFDDDHSFVEAVFTAPDGGVLLNEGQNFFIGIDHDVTYGTLPAFEDYLFRRRGFSRGSIVVQQAHDRLDRESLPSWDLASHSVIVPSITVLLNDGKRKYDLNPLDESSFNAKFSQLPAQPAVAVEVWGTDVRPTVATNDDKFFVKSSLYVGGQPMVGEELVINHHGRISDPNGHSHPVFVHQWMRGDMTGATILKGLPCRYGRRTCGLSEPESNMTAIDGATDPRYTVTAADEGKILQAMVTFYDDDGNEETRYTRSIVVLPRIAIRAPAGQGRKVIPVASFELNTPPSITLGGSVSAYTRTNEMFARYPDRFSDTATGPRVSRTSPPQVSLVNNNTAVRIDIEPHAHADYYYVHRTHALGSGELFNLIAIVEAQLQGDGNVSVIDETVRARSRYLYSISAVNERGEGRSSTYVSISVPSRTSATYTMLPGQSVDEYINGIPRTNLYLKAYLTEDDVFVGNFFGRSSTTTSCPTAGERYLGNDGDAGACGYTSEERRGSINTAGDGQWFIWRPSSTLGFMNLEGVELEVTVTSDTGNSNGLTSPIVEIWARPESRDAGYHLRQYPAGSTGDIINVAASDESVTATAKMILNFRYCSTRDHSVYLRVKSSDAAQTGDYKIELTEIPNADKASAAPDEKTEDC